MRQDFAEDLATTVQRASPLLYAMPSHLASRRPFPQRWSAIEIVGHPIDSASNNHQRFVRACLGEDLRFEGYAQDACVAAQAYHLAHWDEIVELRRLAHGVWIHTGKPPFSGPHAVRVLL
jgi:hypothetical protein